eukprot:scaffold39041_cov57-Attheya_sp.AAC.3
MKFDVNDHHKSHVRLPLAGSPPPTSLWNPLQVIQEEREEEEDIITMDPFLESECRYVAIHSWLAINKTVTNK